MAPGRAKAKVKPKGLKEKGELLGKTEHKDVTPTIPTIKLALPQLLQSLDGHGFRARNGKALPFPVTAACVLPSGARVVTCGEDGTTRIWESSTGKLLWQFMSHRGGALCAVPFLDSRRLLTGGRDGCAQVWELQEESRSAKQLAQLYSTSPDGPQVHGSPVVGAVVFPDAERAITLGLNGYGFVWKLEGGELLGLFQGPISALALSQLGERLVVAKEGGDLEWYTANGQLLSRISSHESLVNALGIFPDGNRVLSAGDDCQGTIWDMDGQVLARLQGLPSPLTCVAISPCGQRVLVGSRDGTALVSDADGRTLSRWLADEAANADSCEILACNFFPDGKQVLLSGAFGIRTWHLPPEAAGGPADRPTSNLD
eukprot:TRINITY_DN67641_c0_g1_i1.p1 TRINITY_DN67641_c0_g1~~TRINITY_DN67641_c0_g1_i1.p1  ORF type:complete len:390 (-),score=65.58 TRINITY_DN67641_c0_g1_i1:42-1157(-)